MPLDRAKARSYVNGARIAYRVGVHSEFIQIGATFLEEALNQLDQDALTASRAQNDAARLQRELDEEKTAYRKLREQSAHAEAAIALLREISLSPKSSKSKSMKFLLAIGAIAERGHDNTDKKI